MIHLWIPTSSNYDFIFEVKLTFEMLIVRGQQPSFSTHERVFLWKCQSFRDSKSVIEPPTFGFMPNVLTYWAIRARHLLSHDLNTGSGGIDGCPQFIYAHK